MGIIVKCPQCNEVNAGSQLNCVKCQASLIGVPREEGESPLPEMVSTPPAEQEKKEASLPPLVFKDEIPPKRPGKALWFILGVVAAALCIVPVICVVIYSRNVIKVDTQTDPIEEVLHAYLRHMADKDAEGAYALFSPRAQRQLPLSKVQELIEGENYMIFEGYLTMSISRLKIITTVNTNPDLPQGQIATVTGVVHYEGGIDGSFSGTLETVDGRWMLTTMYVTGPPNEIKDDNQEPDQT